MSFINSRLWLQGGLYSFGSINKIFEPSVISVRNYAARKGTRERKLKKKGKKVVEEKVGFIPDSLRKKEKLLASRPVLKFDDSWKGLPVDNVYQLKYYRWKLYPFEEAVQCHRETHHPDMYNVPNANLHVRIELFMQGEKKTRLVDDFNRIVAVPHKFDHGEERSIIAFSKSPEVQKEALDAGVQLAGGVDLIKQIQNGGVSLQNFQFIIAHPDILPELVSLRGLMKRKFPNPKTGTLDVDLASVTLRFLHGINYWAKKDEYEKDFGLVETVVGTLDMNPKHLEENFVLLIQDLNTMRPKREGHFISRCLLWSPPSQEKLKVDHNLYLTSQADGIKNKDENDDDVQVGERVAL